MWRISVQAAWQHRRRLLATSLSVVLGVAFLVATLVVGDTLRAGFREAFTDVNAGIDAVVRADTAFGSDASAQSGLLNSGLVAGVRAVDGVAVVAPQVQGLAQIVGADGQAIGGNGPPTLGVSWTDEPTLQSYELVAGRAPTAAGEVAIDAGAAQAGDLDVGDRTVVRTPAPVQVRIVGLLQLRGGPAGGTTITAFRLLDAQRHMLGSTDRISRILVGGADGVGQAQLVERIGEVLPAGSEAITGAALTDETLDELGSDFLDLFETALLMFAAIALLVALLSIANTFSITVAQRVRETALLRTLGAGRRQVVAAVVFEALVVGAVAAAAGLLAGLGLAAGLQPFLGAIGLDLERSTLVVEPATVVAASAVGIGVTLLASVLPAWRSARVAPMAALRDAATDRSGASPARAGIGAALLAAGLGAGVLAVTATTGAMPKAGAATALVCVGVVVLGPFLATPVSGALGSALGRLSRGGGGLARRNAMRNPRRTAATAATLLVGVTVVTLFTVAAASFKHTIDETVTRTFRGDLVVTAAGFSGSGLSPQLAADVAALPEVRRAVGLGLGAARLDGEEKVFTVTDVADAGRLLTLDVTAGSLSAADDGGLAVSSSTAAEQGWQLHAPVAVQFADGTSQDVPVAALFDAGPGDALGTIVMPAALFDAHAVQPTHTTVLVELADGVDVAAGRHAVAHVTAAHGNPSVLDRAEYAEAAAGNVDQLLAVVYGLLGLAIVIALLSVANTLSLSVHERIREIGLLRAVGQTRPQLRAMIRLEAVIVALFGTLTGVALGTFLGWLFIRALAADEGLGLFSVPLLQLAVVAGLGGLVGVRAAARPARRAARTDILVALATE